MTPFMSLWMPVVLSALAVWLLSSVIHMMLPWHKNDYTPFPNEDGVLDALRPFAIPPGDYMAPAPRSANDMKSPDFMAKRRRGPVLIATIMPNGDFNMGKLMGTWFLFNLLIAAIAAWITGSIVAPGPGGHPAFHYSAIVTFLCYTMGEWPLSIWYHRKWSTTLVGLIDGLIYGAATGAVFMLMWPKV